MKRFSAIVAIFALLALAFPAVTFAQTDDDCETMDVTGHDVCNEFLDFWENNGGLPVFGYPLTDAQMETNNDGDTVLTQWFERQRLELHPENAGTVYHVLLGRLGVDVLELMGRDWMTFPKASPSAEHYYPETGHAVAPQFWGYFTSHGLNYGDPGISERESILLFGYPISEPAMETNPDGDTVLTQWFERARFEYHPDNTTEFQVLLGRLGAEAMDLMNPEPEPDFTVVATGLNNPRGIDVAANGDVYVAEAGTAGEDCATYMAHGEGDEMEEVEFCVGLTGAITMISDDEQEQVVTGLPSAGGREQGEAVGPQDVVVSDNGSIYTIIGLGADPNVRAEIGGQIGDLIEGFGYVLEIDENGDWEAVVDVAAFEGSDNPDEGGLDSNPYSFVMHGDGWVVSDAGANALLHVDAEGTITTLAVFPARMVDAPPFLGLPEGTQIPMESVPTGVTVGPDGAIYVGELTGFPFEAGAARVWRVMDINLDGDALDEGETTVYAEGFTNILDMAFDSEGNLYVLEMVKNGLLSANPEDPSTAVGALIKVDGNGTHTEIASEGLILPTGLGIGPDDSIYVSNFGVMPGMGQVVLINPDLVNAE